MRNKIKIGKEVLQIEAKALFDTANVLDHNFQNAVELLEATFGKIIVTGMGKSGHIARKIAATLSSTGKPAHFLHPSEASHGDLGSIDKYDCVLAISNSGETEELYDILHFCKRNNIRIISMTSEKESTLAKASSVCLLLPKVQEACPLGLAPTTTTTLCLALGDALAVALYKDRFTPTDFQEYHPGGKLGSKLLKVEHLMHTGKDVPTVRKNATVADAIIEISKKSLGCVGVVDRGKLIGIITDGDLRRHIKDISMDASAHEIMTRNPRTISGDLFAVDALNIMNKKNITSLFVLQAGKPIGIIHIHDVLRAGVD